MVYTNMFKAFILIIVVVLNSCESTDNKNNCSMDVIEDIDEDIYLDSDNIDVVDGDINNDTIEDPYELRIPCEVSAKTVSELGTTIYIGYGSWTEYGYKGNITAYDVDTGESTPVMELEQTIESPKFVIDYDEEKLYFIANSIYQNIEWPEWTFFPTLYTIDNRTKSVNEIIVSNLESPNCSIYHHGYVQLHYLNTQNGWATISCHYPMPEGGYYHTDFYRVNITTGQYQWIVDGQNENLSTYDIVNSENSKYLLLNGTNWSSSGNTEEPYIRAIWDIDGEMPIQIFREEYPFMTYAYGLSADRNANLYYASQNVNGLLKGKKLNLNSLEEMDFPDVSHNQYFPIVLGKETPWIVSWVKSGGILFPDGKVGVVVPTIISEGIYLWDSDNGNIRKATVYPLEYYDAHLIENNARYIMVYYAQINGKRCIALKNLLDA